jgi:hypothetical protein
LESRRVSGHAEARVTFNKRYSLRSHVLFNSDEFDPSELFWKMVGWRFETGFTPYLLMIVVLEKPRLVTCHDMTEADSLLAFKHPK